MFLSETVKRYYNFHGVVKQKMNPKSPFGDRQPPFSLREQQSPPFGKGRPGGIFAALSRTKKISIHGHVTRTRARNLQPK
jgi:hypothetical protein